MAVACPAEIVSYLLFVLITLAAVYWVCYFGPVTYIRLINEDQWGEYATAVSFGLAGLMLLMLALGSDVRSGKISWALVGILALLIAAEELSWGQRIFRLLFGLDIAPDAIVEINNQGEFSLHNMGNIDFLNRGGLHRVAGQLILIWTLFSLSVERIRPNWIDRMETSGLPIVRMHLAPFFSSFPVIFCSAGCRMRTSWANCHLVLRLYPGLLILSSVTESQVLHAGCLRFPGWPRCTSCAQF